MITPHDLCCRSDVSLPLRFSSHGRWYRAVCSKLKQEGMKLSQIAGILDLSDCTCHRIFLNITAVIQWRIRYILAAKRLPVEGTTTGFRHCHWLSDSKAAPNHVRIQTIIQTFPLARFVFVLYFLYKTKLGIYYIHMKQIYGLYRSSHYSNILVYETDIWVVEVITLQ